MPSNDEFRHFYQESTLGYGGIEIRDGVGVPMSDEEALLLAIPAWVTTVDDPAAVVSLCVEATGNSAAAVRVAALDGLAVMAAKLRELPDRATILKAVLAAKADEDTTVREAATRACDVLGIGGET